MIRRQHRVTPSVGEQWREAQERRPTPKTDQPSDAEIFGSSPETCPTCGGFAADPYTGRDCIACAGTGRKNSAATADGATA